MFGTALRGISLHSPPAVELANTVPSAHPDARSPVTATGAKFAARTDATIVITATSTHTFGTRTDYAMLVQSTAGRTFARRARASKRLGAA